MTARDLKVIGSVIIMFGVYAGVLIWSIWPIQEVSIAKSGVFGDIDKASTCKTTPGLCLWRERASDCNSFEKIIAVSGIITLSRHEYSKRQIRDAYFCWPRIAELNEDVVSLNSKLEI